MVHLIWSRKTLYYCNNNKSERKCNEANAATGMQATKSTQLDGNNPRPHRSELNCCTGGIKGTEKGSSLIETQNIETIDFRILSGPVSCCEVFRSCGNQWRISLALLDSDHDVQLIAWLVCCQLGGLQLEGCAFDGNALTENQRDSASVSAIPACTVAWVPKVGDMVLVLNLSWVTMAW